MKVVPLKNFRSIFKKNWKNITLLTPDEYFSNYNEASEADKLEYSKLKLEPLKSNRCHLISVPRVKIQNFQELFIDSLMKYTPDIVFLQFEPMSYVYSKRILQESAENEILKPEETFSSKFKFSPSNFNEALVEREILDVISAKANQSKIEANESLPDVSFLGEKGELTEKYKILLKTVFNYIAKDNWSPFYEINQTLFLGITAGQPLLLGGMPEIARRQILGNEIPINILRNIYDICITQFQNHKGNIRLKDMTQLLFSHLFQKSQDIYLTSLLKNTLNNAESVLAFVGANHFNPIKTYWNEDLLTVSKAVKIPKRKINESNSDLIEKQAIFDALFEERFWGKSYIEYPFIYTGFSKDELQEGEFNEYIEKYYLYLDKYESPREEVYKQTKNQYSK